MSRRDESRLFIDINSKQRGVPSELLLDIKKLAEYESGEENFYREIFDSLNSTVTSPLYGMLSAASKSKNKISRVTFNASLKSISSAISSKESDEVVEILSDYVKCLQGQIEKSGGNKDIILSSVVFRALVSFFIPVARRVRDRFGPDYNYDNFEEILNPLFNNIQVSKLSGNSQTKIYDYLDKHFSNDFQL